MKTNPINNQLTNQYLGFLQMPTIFGSNYFTGVEDFKTPNDQPPSFDSEALKLIQKHIYLGKRAEYFMLHYLSQQEHISKVMHSIQIQNERETLGEIDFLFFDKLINKWVHLELVTKFYIYNSGDNIENYTHWIGPNLKDRFEFKLNKLKKHQLQLLKLPEATSKLKTLDINPDQVETQVCYKAKLFLPVGLDQFQHQVTSPDGVCGTYFNIEYFKSFQHKPYLYYIPQKLDWVTSPELQTHWYSFDKASDLLRSKLKEKRSCLLWRKTADEDYFEDVVVWWN